MAAPRKSGLDYFPLDVGIFHDIKMIPLKARYGAAGMITYIDILCKIYGDKGYYIKLDNDFYFIISDEIKVNENTIRQVVNFLLERSLFDNKLFQSDKVLTSRSIQKRYQEAVTNRARKSNILVVEKYWLLKKEETRSFIKFTHFSEGTSNNGVNTCKNHNNYMEKPSKVKESKVKENKEDIATESKDSASTQKTFTLNSFEFKASKYLRDNILSRIAKARVPKTDEEIQKWAVHIDRMKRLDKLTEEEIRNLIKYATTDVFWQSNILSTKKLREKKDTLYAHMLSEKNKNTIIYNKQQLPKSMQGISAWIEHNGLED